MVKVLNINRKGVSSLNVQVVYGSTLQIRDIVWHIGEEALMTSVYSGKTNYDKGLKTENFMVAYLVMQVTV